MDEFALIQEFFSNRITAHRADVLIGIGDDCAVLEVPTGHQLAVSIDTLVAGVHFPHETSANDIGHKALAVNLSDLAAMGAKPAWITLALTLPKLDKFWLEGFCEGLFALAQEHHVELIGGDITKGPLSISIQAHGFIPQDAAITRGGAQPGDLIYVTNTLGDAGLALKRLQCEFRLKQAHNDFIFMRLNRPTPRIKEGILLRGISHSMIDISDGLAADLDHILKKSKVGAVIYTHKLPLSTELKAELSPLEAQTMALTAGDDYELCFTIPKDKQILLENTMSKNHILITCIGEINDSKRLELLGENGQKCEFSTKGYLHFQI